MNQTEREYREAMDSLRFSDKKKEHIMKNLMETGKQNRKGRRVSVRAMLLAAALAVGCVLSIAAGLPAQVYNFMTGGSLTVMPAGGGIIGGATMEMGSAENAPIILEDGKLWFVYGGERTDLTGLIDQDTPYIYEHTDPATGNKGCVILGGTPDDFGWVEIALLDGGTALSGNNYDSVSLAELYEAQENGGHEERGGKMKILDTGSHKPWFQTALDQLGLDL